MENKRDTKIKALEEETRRLKVLRCVQNAEYFLFEGVWPRGVDAGELDWQYLEFLQAYVEFKGKEFTDPIKHEKTNVVIEKSQPKSNMICLKLSFDNYSEHISSLNKALAHVVEMAAGFDEDELTYNDMFWMIRLN